MLAVNYGPEFWLALIIACSIYRAGSGLGHTQQMIKARNFAINNTAILFLNFVPAIALLGMYYAWIT